MPTNYICDIYNIVITNQYYGTLHTMIQLLDFNINVVLTSKHEINSKQAT